MTAGPKILAAGSGVRVTAGPGVLAAGSGIRVTGDIPGELKLSLKHPSTH